MLWILTHHLSLLCELVLWALSTWTAYFNALYVGHKVHAVIQNFEIANNVAMSCIVFVASVKHSS